MIKAAYVWVEREGGGTCLPLTAAKAHEVRAWSATMAALNAVPMSELLRAAYWRNVDVFIEHYLRNTSRARDNGSFGVTSMVAAQTCLSSHRAYTIL